MENLFGFFHEFYTNTASAMASLTLVKKEGKTRSQLLWASVMRIAGINIGLFILSVILSIIGRIPDQEFFYWVALIVAIGWFITGMFFIIAGSAISSILQAMFTKGNDKIFKTFARRLRIGALLELGIASFVFFCPVEANPKMAVIICFLFLFVGLISGLEVSKDNKRLKRCSIATAIVVSAILIMFLFSMKYADAIGLFTVSSFDTASAVCSKNTSDPSFDASVILDYNMISAEHGVLDLDSVPAGSICIYDAPPGTIKTLADEGSSSAYSAGRDYIGTKSGKIYFSGGEGRFPYIFSSRRLSSAEKDYWFEKARMK